MFCDKFELKSEANSCFCCSASVCEMVRSRNFFLGADLDGSLEVFVKLRIADG